MTPHGTAALIARLRGELGERELDILRSLQRVRLLTTDHVTRLHFTDNSPSTRARRARATLRRLTERQLTVRLGRQLGGVKAGSSGSLFGLTGRGMAVVEAPTARKQRRRTIWEARPHFQDHLLAVAELYVRLTELCSGSAAELLAFDAEPACWRRFSGVGGEPITLKPDAFVRLGVGDYELTSFIEVDLGTESLPTIRRKCQVYLRYWRSGLEQQRSGVFPRVIWLVPDQHRVAGVASVLKRLLRGVSDGLFVVATVDTGVEVLTTLPRRGGVA